MCSRNMVYKRYFPVCLAVIYVLDCCNAAPRILGHNFKDYMWLCNEICSSSVGAAFYDKKSQMCRCSLNKNMDDTDIALMQKNAKNLGLVLETIEPYNKVKIVIKRDTSQKSNPNELTPLQKLISTHKASSSSRPYIPIQPPPSQISPEENRQMLDQIKKRLDSLSKGPAKSASKTQSIDSLRGQVNRLSHKINSARSAGNAKHKRVKVDAKTLTVPKYKARGSLRERLERLRANRDSDQTANKHKGLLRSTANNQEENPQSIIEDTKNKILGGLCKPLFNKEGGEIAPPQHTIITQPPNLIDD